MNAQFDELISWLYIFAFIGGLLLLVLGANELLDRMRQYNIRRRREAAQLLIEHSYRVRPVIPAKRHRRRRRR